MTGVVLCGGLSSRMKTDKALLEINKITWLEKAVRLLQSIPLEVKVSCNSNQFENYQKRFDNLDFVVDKEIYAGPLRALLSSFEVIQDSIFVLACDMPLMQVNPILEIIKAYTQNQSHDAYLYKHDGFYEPLCALYTKKGLKKLKQDIPKEGGDYSLQKILKSNLQTKVLTLDDYSFFQNFNTREALKVLNEENY